MIGYNEWECWSVICEGGITAPFVCALYHSIRHILTLLKWGSHLYPTIIVNQREDISALLGQNEICFSSIPTPRTGELLGEQMAFFPLHTGEKGINTSKGGSGPCCPPGKLWYQWHRQEGTSSYVSGRIARDAPGFPLLSWRLFLCWKEGRDFRDFKLCWSSVPAELQQLTLGRSTAGEKNLSL